MKAPADKLGDEFAAPMVGRGVAFGDLDGDGDLDLLLTAVGGPPRLLENKLDGANWLRVRLQGTTSNRDAIGAEVVAKVAGKNLRRRVMPTRGYLSQSERVVTFGLGETDKVEELTVFWPGGASQRVEVDGVNKVLEVRQQP